MKRRMNPVISLLLSAALAVPLMNVAVADEAADRGLEIARDRKQRDEGWGTSEAQLTMTLRNAQGEESVRQIRTRSLEVKDDGDKGLTIFDEPKDVKGTSFLNFSHIAKPDDQWLYMPALKRVKRIASRNKSGPFMGSEFAYEDMSSFELEKYSFRYLRDEMVDGTDSYVLEQTPLDEFSGYTKQVVWLDKEHLRGLKIEFYDRKQSLLKTLTLGDYQLYKDKYWRAHTATMVNHQTGKSTVLKTLQLTFDTGLTDADFNETTLMRAR
ncbi:outer membrane lipoprotein-sorting protein [Thalassolituus sp. LLYu03]|uniref:outer membrane lipoprotein-sorting protein n=1 Tax=Thalassolituus sp. LLYu03 TaxID=3421656 RepID=UPI003D299391